MAPLLTVTTREGTNVGEEKIVRDGQELAESDDINEEDSRMEPNEDQTPKVTNN